MKTIRQLFAAAILTSTLTAVVWAGDMQTPGIVPPPPPSLPSAAPAQRTGAGVLESAPAHDALTEAALLLCYKALSLL